jgi:cbb3-type cytochrome oxidase cytochrome c subunit
MDARRRRRWIAAGGIVALVAVATIVVVITGGASSDSPGVGPAGTYSAHTIDDVPRWIHEEQLPPDALNGAKLFAVSGCTTCHTYAGSGTSALHAPDLTAIGSRHLGVDYEVQKLRCPECVTPGSVMPRFDSLGAKRLRQLAVFLEASKGVRQLSK